MRNIKRMLTEQGEQYENVSAPDNLMLLVAEKIKQKKPAFPVKKVAVFCAVILLAACMLTVSVFAHFSGGVFSFNSIVVDSVSDAIQRENAYQAINQNCVFPNGDKLSVDGAVVDNDRILIYGIFQGNSETANLPSFKIFRGNREIVQEGSSSTGNSASGKYESIIELKNIKVLKKFTLRACNAKNETHDFSVKLNTGVGKSRVYRINKTVEVDGTKIILKSLRSNVTSVTLEYKLSLPGELRAHNGWFDNACGVSIMADGQRIGNMGEQVSSGGIKEIFPLNTLNFTVRKTYEPLPADAEKITLCIEKVPVLTDSNPVEIEAQAGRTSRYRSAEFTIVAAEKKQEGVELVINGNCLFYSDYIYGKANGKRIQGERISWQATKEGYRHTYIFKNVSDLETITVEKFVYNRNVYMCMEL